MNHPEEERNTIQPISNQTKWREDFPVDRPQYQYISRREFTKFLVMISGAFALGQFWIAFLSGQRQKGQPAEAVRKIATLDALPVGGFLTFHYPNEGDACLLIRTANDRFVAYNNKCTHLMCPVIPKVSEKELYCPCHQGHFNLEDGRPIAGPPTRPLARVKLMVREGAIYATGMETASS